MKEEEPILAVEQKEFDEKNKPIE
jgi:hypothetical protein